MTRSPSAAEVELDRSRVIPTVSPSAVLRLDIVQSSLLNLQVNTYIVFQLTALLSTKLNLGGSLKGR